MTETTSNPLRLLRLLILGTLLACASYGLSFLPFATEPVRSHGFLLFLWSYRLPILVTSLPFLAGAGLIWHTYRRLESGIRLEKWTPAELIPARTLIDSPVLICSVIMLALAGALASLIALLLSTPHHHSHANLGYWVIWAMHPILRIRTMLKPPRPKPIRHDWQTLTPAFSSHWGTAESAGPLATQSPNRL